MLKKIAFATVAVAAGLFLLGQTRVASYGCTAWKKIRQETKKQVPIEFEIERLRHEVTQLVPDMKKNLSVIAEEIVAVQNLREDIDRMRASLDRQREQIRAMKDDLKSGTERVMFNGRLYSASLVREKLAGAVSAAQLADKEVTTKEQVLEAKERALDAAREQLASMRAQKQHLELEVAQLEADLKTVRLAQTRSKVQFDDSRLAHIKASLADLRTRLKVERTELDLAGEFADGAPVFKAKTNEQVIKEAEAYLGEDRDAGAKVAVEKRQ